MQSVLEFITSNYIWLLGGPILILLAIIGSYADKTNFGQGKNNQNVINKEEESSLKEIQIDENARISDKLGQNIKKSNKEIEVLEQQSQPVVQSKEGEQQVLTNNDTEPNEQLQKNKQTQTMDVTNQETISDNQTESSIDLDDKFEKFNVEFEELLPKKDIMDDDLLNEIDNLTLDKTQKIDLSDIPNLDDVELPKIKSLEPKEQDIWKF